MTQWGLDAIFNPAKRHMDEEKQRLQSTREEVGDSSGGKRIDFESGKVIIRKRVAGSDDSGDSEMSVESTEFTESGGSDESVASADEDGESEQSGA